MQTNTKPLSNHIFGPGLGKLSLSVLTHQWREVLTMGTWHRRVLIVSTEVILVCMLFGHVLGQRGDQLWPGPAPRRWPMTCQKYIPKCVLIQTVTAVSSAKSQVRRLRHCLLGETQCFKCHCLFTLVKGQSILKQQKFDAQSKFDAHLKVYLWNHWWWDGEQNCYVFSE